MTERTIDRLAGLSARLVAIADFKISWHTKIDTNCSGDRYIASTSNREAMVLATREELMQQSIVSSSALN